MQYNFQSEKSKKVIVKKYLQEHLVRKLNQINVD